MGYTQWPIYTTRAGYASPLHCFKFYLGLLDFLPAETCDKLLYVLPKSMWDDIQPISVRETIANRPEPTKEPIPEKKKKSPMMALCMDLGAAE